MCSRVLFFGKAERPCTESDVKGASLYHIPKRKITHFQPFNKINTVARRLERICKFRPARRVISNHLNLVHLQRLLPRAVVIEVDECKESMGQERVMQVMHGKRRRTGNGLKQVSVLNHVLCPTEGKGFQSFNGLVVATVHKL
jgi:hypothetical protein